MPNDLPRLFEQLREDTTTDFLADPAALRKEGTHRRRVRSAIGTTAVAIGTVAAIVVTTIVLPLGAPSPGPVPPATPSLTSPAPTPDVTSSGPSPSGSPTANPSASTPTGASIPDLAFLQPSDIDGAEPYDVSGADLLPSICAATLGSAGDIAAQRARQVIYSKATAGNAPFPEGTFDALIRVYDNGGATRFMTELRAAVAGCAVDQDAEPAPLRYEVVNETLPGDEAISFTTTGRYEPQPGTFVDSTTPYQVIRVENAILILMFRSWEGLNYDEALAKTVRDRASRPVRAVGLHGLESDLFAGVANVGIALTGIKI